MERSKLIKKIISASTNYYEGNPTISDTEFDGLIDELKEEEPENDILKSVGWGAEFTRNTKYKHLYGKVGSLEKIHYVSELKEKHSFSIVSAKLDGSTCVAYYKDGILLKALSRGNGDYGFDRTEKYVKIVSKYKLNIPKDFTGAIRGEILFKKDNFEKYKKEHNIDERAPRNISTGLFMSDEFTSDLDYIDFITYKIIGSKDEYLCYEEMLDKLQKYGFEVVPYEGIHSVLTDDILINKFKEFEKYFPIDGIVINTGINRDGDNYTFEDIAYKLQAEIKETSVKNISWALSKNNVLIPVVNIDTVVLSGANVNKTSGFNYNYILTNKIGEGSIIDIQRSGEVIPYIVKVKNTGKLDIPKYCPICGKELKVSGVNLVCDNEDCQNIKYSRLKTWIEVVGIRDNVLGVGDILLDRFCKFLNKLNIYDFNEIYIDRNILDSIITSGLFTLHETTILEAILNNLNLEVTADKALFGLNIKGLGLVNCKKISQYFNLFNDYENFKNKILSIDGLGDSTLISIDSNKSMISNMLLLKIVKNPVKVEYEGQITITGTLSIARKEFEKICEEKHYQVSDNITKSKYLICNNVSNSSKYLKAKKLNIPIISESEFMRILNKN